MLEMDAVSRTHGVGLAEIESHVNGEVNLNTPSLLSAKVIRNHRRIQAMAQKVLHSNVDVTDKKNLKKKKNNEYNAMLIFKKNIF